MAKQTPEAIAQWAEKQERPADTPAYRRMTDAERALILFLDKEGLTQVEIAQRLGRAQSTISEWLTECSDTTEAATRYLRGQALRNARRIVEEGRPADLIPLLKGTNVIADEQVKAGVTVIIGIKDSEVVLNAQPSEGLPGSVDVQRLSPPLTQDSHRLSGDR